MKIAILDAITLGEDISLDIFKEFGSVEIYETTLAKETLNRVKNCDIIITNKVVIDKEIMQKSPNLKLICIAATGMNNVDLQAAKELGIVVKNVAGYSTKSVVQHTFAMAFYLIEQLSYYDSFVKSNKWSKSGIFTNLDRPFWQVAGKKWGVIGLGEIGKEVAKVATAFGCDVCYYSTSGNNSNSEYKRVELIELMSSCDIISIHAPLNENTQDLIRTKELNALKEGSVLLNLGRGGIVNEDDLAVAIDSKNILVATDVTTKEPIESNNALLKVKNSNRLLITPHIAWASKEAREKLIEGIVKNIKDFLND